MDILKGQSRKKAKITRFTIHAIASAVLVFHAEVASAASCPSQIVGTSLAGVVCDFDNGSSVTVANGGEAGGINLDIYAPPDPSHITINAGGTIINGDENSVGITVSNTSLSEILNNGTISTSGTNGIGVLIQSASLLNGIANNGTISNTHSNGIGINITTSAISGGLSNSGLISAGLTAIRINSSNLSGTILNSGTISSTNGTGILISHVNATNGITNSGTIRGSGVDVGIAIINHSTVGAITNSGLIEATGSGNGIVMYGTSTINGGISNSGTIQSAGHTGISVNVSSVQGNILNSGTISGAEQGLSIHNASTVNGALTNSGTIQGGNNGISIYSSTTVSGGLSNSGTISGNNTGLSITSSSTISGGISNSGTIQGNIKAIHIDSSSPVDHINILGQSARIIGAVDAANTTVNITSGARFTSEGTFNVEAFNIQSNAVFNMANAITVQDIVYNAGRLSVGNTLQTITGDYTQGPGGLFQMGASSTNYYGRLLVTGSVDLSQSGLIYVQVNPNASLHVGDVLSHVISGNTLILPTNGFEVSDNSFIWKFIASTDNNGVNITATIDPAAYSACQGDYCQGAATTIIGQIAAGNSEFNPYALLTSASAFKTAASQATPELTNENIQVLQWATTSVMDVVPMWHTLHGQSAGDAMLYQPGKMWFKPYSGSMAQGKSHSVDGFTAKAYGAVIGKDISLSEEGSLGGAFAIGKDNINGSSVLDGQSIHSNTYQGLVYGAKKFPRNIYLAAQGLVGYGDNDTERSIPLYTSTADGRYNSWFADLRAEVGCNIPTKNQNFVLTPEIDASYLFVHQSSYKESGSLMDLSVDPSNNSSLVLGAYGFGAYRLFTLNNQQDVALTGYAGVARNVLNSRPQTTATFVAGGPSFATFGVQWNQTLFRGGAGLVIANPAKPLRVALNYDLQTGNHAHSGVGSMTVTYKI